MYYTPEKRREDAMRRQQEFASLTPQQKLNRLTERGHGNSREAQKYREQIAAETRQEAIDLTKSTIRGVRKSNKAPHTSNRKRGKK